MPVNQTSTDEPAASPRADAVRGFFRRRLRLL